MDKNKENIMDTESLAPLKQAFLTSVTHELRTPLNDIISLSALLQEEVYGPLNKKQLKTIGNIEKRGKHLLNQINDILEFSRIVSGQLKITTYTVPVISACEAALTLIKKEADKKNIEIVSDLESSVKSIETDGKRLKQILVNLLKNAVKFTPEGGKIGLRLTGDSENKTANFSIWDTGIGIEKENMDNLFKPFIQLDNKLSREYSGVGLGLTLVQRITDLLGGGVFLESEAKKGSTFTVKLPWNTEREEELEKNDSTASSIHSKLILLTEDNRIVLKVCSDYLKKKGYRVNSAGNGEEALRLIEKEKPDMIFMDIQMPVMNGLEATRKIRQNKDYSDIPIIALTALTLEGAEESCIKAGATEYMKKPVSLQNMKKMIEKYLTAEL